MSEVYDRQRTLDLALRIGELLLSNGAGAADVTATMSSVAHHLGLRQTLVDVTFTTLTLSHQSGIDEPVVSLTRHVTHRETDFADLTAVDYVMTKLLADEMVVRAPVDAGTLRNAIYTWHDDKQSGPLKQVYFVGVNKREASHWFWIEYGHWRYNQSVNGYWQKSKSKPNARGPSAHDLPSALPSPVWVPAVPYIRPTADRMGDAIQAMQARLAERLREISSEAGAADVGAAQSVERVTA